MAMQSSPEAWYERDLFVGVLTAILSVGLSMWATHRQTKAQIQRELARQAEDRRTARVEAALRLQSELHEFEQRLFREFQHSAYLSRREIDPFRQRMVTDAATLGAEFTSHLFAVIEAAVDASDQVKRYAALRAQAKEDYSLQLGILAQRIESFEISLQPLLPERRALNPSDLRRLIPK